MNAKQAERMTAALTEYASAGRLRGMRGSPLHGATPETLAEAVMSNKHHRKVISTLEAGKSLEYSGSTISPEELSRFRSDMGIAGRDLLVRLQGSMPSDRSAWFLKPFDSVLTDAVVRLDRAFFKVSPGRCMRIRPSSDTEVAEMDVTVRAREGMVGRTLVVLVDRETDTMARLGWLRPALPELNEQGLDDGRIERLVDMMIEQSNGRTALLHARGWLAGTALLNFR